MSVGDVVFSPTATVALLTTLAAAVTGTVMAIVIVRALINRPASRTTARERLERRNPALRDRTDLRWKNRAHRVRTDRLTTFVVSVALLLATSSSATTRPTTVQPTDDR